MSETETHIGKAKLLENETLDSLCEKHGIEGEDEHEKRDIFYDKFYEKYIIVDNNTIYEVIEDKDCEYENIYQASKNEDGTISYLLQYYNGGCSFGEAFETAIENMNNDDI